MGRFIRVCILLVLSSTLVMPVARAAGEGVTEEEIKAEKRVLRLINTYRVESGLSELVAHTLLTREARKHSNYQANHGELSHDGFDERAQRIADEDGGIDADKICENVASAQGYDRPGAVARLVVRAWTKAKAKRTCLLDDGFTKQSAGVGVEHRGDSWYLTFLNAHDTTP